MHKIKLEVEDLQVESFATAETGNELGTVRAYGDAFIIGDEAGTDATCPPVNTCNQTHCGGYSCGWTECPGDGCKPAEEQAALAGF
jgi:hypothetical protein